MTKNEKITFINIFFDKNIVSEESSDAEIKRKYKTALKKATEIKRERDKQYKKDNAYLFGKPKES